MADAADAQITRLLSRARAGDAGAAEQLMPLLYAHLHERAAALMRRESRAVTLQPTALVHEAWVRLQQSPGAEWTDRGHFLRLAGRVMRNVLIDSARRRRTTGSETEAGGVSVAVGSNTDELVSVLDLHAAMERLGERDPELEHLVELRFFGGLTLEETAATLGKSVTATHRAWELARAFLLRALQTSGE